jgi:hypothetical protein
MLIIYIALIATHNLSMEPIKSPRQKTGTIGCCCIKNLLVVLANCAPLKR